jgi:2-polyprenyl-6-methoxyphenol hydroxylase-like FAD-dependent oxidoreductase
MWAVILAGMDGMYPAVDAKEFEEQLATSGISPQVLAVLHGAEPLGEPRGYRIPVCIRQHYEQMEQWPAGLLVLGDALCSFDPIYGQGMDAAAVAAETLEECLQEPQTQVRPAFERHVLQRIQEVIQPAWWISTIADLRARGITYCRFRWPVV